MRSFLDKKPCLIRSPSAVRPWQFVLEPLRGYLLLAERLSEDPSPFASAWNFGPVEADAKPVSWIAENLARSWGGEASWRTDAEKHPREAHYLKLDVSKANAELGWTPVLPLASAMEWISEWYRAFERADNLGPLTQTQIERYEALLNNSIKTARPLVDK
jgi:CDP-glucose 4,6-dehydratase